MKSKSIKKSCLLFFCLLTILSLNISDCFAGEYDEFEETKLKSNSTEENEISSPDYEPDAEVFNQTLVDAHPKMMENDDGSNSKKAFSTEFGLDQNYDEQVEQSSNPTEDIQEIELEIEDSTDREKISDIEFDSESPGLNSTEEIQDFELDSDSTGLNSTQVEEQGEASSFEDENLHKNETQMHREEFESDFGSLQLKINAAENQIVKEIELEESGPEVLIPLESDLNDTSISTNRNESSNEFEEFHNTLVDLAEVYDDSITLFDYLYGSNDSQHENHTSKTTRIKFDNDNLTLDLQNELDNTNNSILLDSNPDLVYQVSRNVDSNANSGENDGEIIFEPDEELRALRHNEIFDTSDNNEDSVILFEESFSSPLWFKKWHQYLVSKSNNKTRKLLKHQGKFKFTQGQLVEANDGRKMYQIWSEISSQQSLGKFLKISYQISTTPYDCTQFELKLYKCPGKWTYKSWKPPPLLVMENLDCFNLQNGSHIFSTGLGFGPDQDNNIRNKTRFKDFDVELEQLNTYTLIISDEGLFQMQVNGLVVENGYFNPETYMDLNQMCRLDLYLVKQKSESIFQIDDILVVTYN